MRYLLLFLLTAGLSTWVLDRILPPMGEEIVAAKLSSFAERKDEYSLLVLGSSQSYRGFDPAVFDEWTARAGLETRSFNLGVPGTIMAEGHRFLERIAELEPANLRWVLIESERVVRADDELGYLTRKNIAWHDLESTRLAWPYLAQVAEDRWQAIGARWRALVALSYHTIGVGRGVPWVEAWIGVDVSELQRARWVGPREDGFQCLGDGLGPGIDERRRGFQRRKRVSQHYLDVMRTRHFELDRPVTDARPFFERIEALAGSIGARAIFFTIRRGYWGCESHVLAEEGKIGGLIHFDDVKRFPELYDVRYTFDGKHFNRVGATLFSRYFAAEFVELVESSPQ